MDSERHVRWRPVMTVGSFGLGIDDEGRFVRVGANGEVFLAEPLYMLFFLPLLDAEHEEFIAQAERAGEPVLRGAEVLANQVVQRALRERASSYIERALRWCETMPVTDETRASLMELDRSRRGIQALRHRAYRLAKAARRLG